MPSLVEAQANFIATINEGPAALDESLFAGDPGRVMLGLRAHANTVSHGRLIALEESFPRCLEALGREAFNALSRDFCDSPPARASDNNALGGEFLRFINAQDLPADIGDLAAIEWLWLAAYHAAEAAPLSLADLAGLEEEELLAMPASPHPAARAHALCAPLSAALPELAAHSQAKAILITRPAAEVALSPLGALELALFDALEKNVENNFTLGNLLALCAEQETGDDALAPVITLINAGAFREASTTRDRNKGKRNE